MSRVAAFLEATDHLFVARYEVEDDPQVVPAFDSDPRRARAEPDLAFSLGGEVCPVEMQREVSERTLANWPKSLKLVGQLALIFYSKEARAEADGDPARRTTPVAWGHHQADQPESDDDRPLGWPAVAIHGWR